MLKANTYKNGQITFEQKGDLLTYFFKDGKVKAEGKFINELMESEWKFYRETGQLWQVGNFKNGKKDGKWVRYDKTDKLEYEEVFKDNKIVKK